MNKHKQLVVILLAILFIKCGGAKETTFSISESTMKEKYTQNDNLVLEISNPKNELIDSVSYSINDKKLGSTSKNTKGVFNLQNQKLGFQNILAKIYFDGDVVVDSTKIEITSQVEPKLLSYKIINVYPHDQKAYTQGLEFYNDTLYEGTGNGAGNDTGVRGTSSLRKINYKTGKIISKIELDNSVFGEGITVLNNKVFQLTYQNNEAYVYSASNLKKEKTIPYFKNMEGWGLTSDGKNLYMTDSSEMIHILDPTTFKQIDYINVYSGTNKIAAVNELEWVNGKIFGNIYQKDAIAQIDPKTGSVEGILNLIELKNKISKLPDTDVLNGIAYNPKTKTFFVTGKNWDKMFEISITN
jgi:glutaminyl-peptide cyclotransferase